MSIGPWQIVLILVIVLIIFGAGKLPKVAGDLAKGIKNFKSGLKDTSGDDEEAEPAEPPRVARSEGAGGPAPGGDTSSGGGAGADTAPGAGKGADTRS